MFIKLGEAELAGNKNGLIHLILIPPKQISTESKYGLRQLIIE